MKKKVSKKKRERNSCKLVPKGYGRCVCLYAVVSVLMIPITVIILMELIRGWHGFEAFEAFEILGVLMLPILNVMVIIYMIFSIVRICSGKIYLEVSQGVLKFSGVLFERSMAVSDIKRIRRLKGSLAITRKTGEGMRMSNKIKFPVIWFAERDIEKFLLYLDEVNRGIEWRGF